MTEFIHQLARQFVQFRECGGFKALRRLSRDGGDAPEYDSDKDALDASPSPSSQEDRDSFGKDSLSLYLKWLRNQNSHLVSKNFLRSNALLLRCEHWLEAADEKHRYGSNLRPFFDYWVENVEGLDDDDNHDDSDGPEVNSSFRIGEDELIDDLLDDGRGGSKVVSPGGLSPKGDTPGGQLSGGSYPKEVTPSGLSPKGGPPGGLSPKGGTPGGLFPRGGTPRGQSLHHRGCSSAAVPERASPRPPSELPWMHPDGSTSCKAMVKEKKLLPAGGWQKVLKAVAATRSPADDAVLDILARVSSTLKASCKIASDPASDPASASAVVPGASTSSESEKRCNITSSDHAHGYGSHALDSHSGPTQLRELNAQLSRRMLSAHIEDTVAQLNKQRSDRHQALQDRVLFRRLSVVAPPPALEHAHSVLETQALVQGSGAQISQSKDSFFRWLDCGGGKDLDLSSIGVPRSKLESELVTYLTPQQQEHYEVVVDAVGGGRLVYKLSGEPLHTYEPVDPQPVQILHMPVSQLTAGRLNIEGRSRGVEGAGVFHVVNERRGGLEALQEEGPEQCRSREGSGALPSPSGADQQECGESVNDATRPACAGVRARAGASAGVSCKDGTEGGGWTTAGLSRRGGAGAGPEAGGSHSTEEDQGAGTASTSGQGSWALDPEGEKAPHAEEPWSSPFASFATVEAPGGCLRASPAAPSPRACSPRACSPRACSPRGCSPKGCSPRAPPQSARPSSAAALAAPFTGMAAASAAAAHSADTAIGTSPTAADAADTSAAGDANADKGPVSDAEADADADRRAASSTDADAGADTRTTSDADADADTAVGTGGHVLQYQRAKEKAGGMGKAPEEKDTSKVSRGKVEKEEGKSKEKKEKWIYVVDTDCRIFCAKKERGKFHHSSFLQGAAVLAAGGLQAYGGYLTKLNADSGHYWPKPEHFRWFYNHLEGMGADLSGLAGIEFKTKH